MSQPFDDRHDDGPNPGASNSDLAPGQDSLTPDHATGDQPYDNR